MFSFLCNSIGILLPSLRTDISIELLGNLAILMTILDIVGSRCLLSAALTNISSNILSNAGLYETTHLVILPIF